MVSPHLASAQSKPRKPTAAAHKAAPSKSAKTKVKRSVAKADAKKPEARLATTGAADAAANTSKPATPKPANALADDQSADIRKEGDTEVKVMQFSGLDIEGQLKTPQMLYFLNRLRAEFGRPALPHRSFMPELQRGTREKAF